ncbi:hypothetical protein PpBr36_01394 [Pyricularia pennisetigena]|uniref:hypothetical protein n=1 Tax=Pyricularia pennisetigena TaxID=1578925 RepID=UPI001151BA9A|nr:hypothetical protein PpBr36_01394 [Pyricularia pennisetigena]TLS28035.1 hypothetical protein PpBr36_01394 [Pyricularia pennisetigena]
MFSPLLDPDPILCTTGPNLNIQIDGGDKHFFSPGDTIIGTVSRQTPIVAPHCSIRLSLHGRSLVRILEWSGSHVKTHAGQVGLIRDLEHTQVLFEGPLHVAAGAGRVAQSWAFAVDLPSHVELERPDLGLGGNHHSFVAAAATHPHPLPQSFSCGAFPLRSSGHIEYYLKAVLQYRTHGGGEGSDGGRTLSATLPVEVRRRNHEPLPPPPPIADFGAVTRRQPTCVRSYRLLPGTDAARGRRLSLLLLQKAHSAVGSSRVPALHGEWELTTPTVVQPGNPARLVPVSVRLVPDDARSSAAVRGSPPRIRLLALRLRVHGLAVVQCRGGWRPTPRTQTCSRETECRIWPPPGPPPAPVYIPCTDGSPALDVAAEAGFLLPALTPTFETFNIRLYYRFEYRLHVEIAGDDVEVLFSEEVTVLPPLGDGPRRASLEGRSESWIRPPCESEPPPSFDEAMLGEGLGRLQV